MAKRIELDECGVPVQPKNNCTVRALHHATGLPYEVCHHMMKLLGRKDGRGAYFGTVHEAARRLGFEIIEVNINEMKELYVYEKYYKTKSVTVRHFEEEPIWKHGTFFAHTRGHVLALVNGKVKDWTSGRSHRVFAMYRVIPKK